MRGMGLFLGFRRRQPVPEVGGGDGFMDFSDADNSGLLAALMIGA